MSNTHVDLISPDEIVDFIKKQNVSEEKATGIKLLRRSAETIAYLQDKIAIFKDQKLWGVFDFDSTKLNNFDETDEKYLTEIAKAIFA